MAPWLQAILTVLLALVILFCTYLLLIKPGKRREGMEKYKGVRFAHRGLHSATVPENSLTAFRLAVEAGYGIEFDVHAAKDGTPMVFHDGTLNRMVGIDGRICDFTAEELGNMRLLDTDEKIPTLREVLDVVDGKIPLLVELKQNEGEVGVAKAAAEILREYRGDFIVESFNPVTLKEFAEEMPEVLRGILSMHFTREKKHRNIKHFLTESLIFNRVCSPDFIAYNHVDADFLPFVLAKKIWDAPTVAWTTRSLDDEALAWENGFDAVIFENYIPENNK